MGCPVCRHHKKALGKYARKLEKNKLLALTVSALKKCKYLCAIYIVRYVYILSVDV